MPVQEISKEEFNSLFSSAPVEETEEALTTEPVTKAGPVEVSREELIDSGLVDKSFFERITDPQEWANNAKEFGQDVMQVRNWGVGTLGNVAAGARDTALVLAENLPFKKAEDVALRGADALAGALGYETNMAGSMRQKNINASNMLREATDKVLPSFELSKDAPWYQKMAQEVLEAGIGGAVLGGPLRAAVPKITRFTSQKANYLAELALKGAATEVGIAAGMNPNTDPLLVSDSPDEWGIPGFNSNNIKDKSKTQQIVELRMNLLLDGLVTGTIASGGIAAATAVARPFAAIILGAGGKITDMVGWTNIGQKNIAKEMTAILAGITDETSPEDARAAMLKLSEIMKSKKGQEFIRASQIDSRLKDIEAPEDVFSLLSKYLSDADIDPATGQRVPNHMREIFAERQAQLDRAEKAWSGPRIEGVRRTSVNNFKKDFLDALDAFPTGVATPSQEQVVSSTKRGLDKVVQETMDLGLGPSRQALNNAEDALGDIILKGDAFLRADETYMPILNDLGSKVNIDVSAPADASGEKLVRHLFGVRNAMNTHKRKLYNAIPGKVYYRDIDTLQELAEEIMPFIGKSNADKFTEVLNSKNPTLRSIQKAYSDYVAPFRTAQNLPAGKIEDFNAFSTYMKNPDNWMDASGETTSAVLTRAKEALTEADNFVKDHWLRWQESDVLREVANAADNVGVPGARRARTGSGHAIQSIDNALSGNVRQESAELIDMVRRDTKNIPEYIQDQDGQITDFVIKRAAEDMQTLINQYGKGTLSPERFKEKIASFERYGATLSQLSGKPNQYFNDFLTKMRDLTFNRADAESLLKAAQTNLEAAEDRIFGRTLQGLVDTITAGRRLFGSPKNYEAMSRTVKDMMLKGGRERDLEMLVDAAKSSGDIQALDALKGMFSKAVRESWFNKNGLPDTNYLQSFLKRETPLSHASNIIWGDDSINKLVLDSAAEKFIRQFDPRPGRLMHPIDVGQQAVKERQYIDRIITWAFGILNPRAARIRTVTGQILSGADPTDALKDFLDGVTSNPEELEKIIQEMLKKEQRQLTGAQKDAIARIVGKGLLYSWRDQEKPAYEETEKLLEGE